MVFRKGRFGKFLACPKYPECTGKQTMRRNYTGNQEKGDDSKPETTDEKCPKCGKPMVVRRGRFGKFLACSGFPKCKATKKIETSAESSGPPEKKP
ncbi:MAG: topoisomerase DNA-binding C4 zinc finger domain-containing protein [Chloroflexi bacterium]|nr:topoisomerase DNA-binding C4 zinc finger domain-containing protein [Chloroflexota bacterium]